MNISDANRIAITRLEPDPADQDTYLPDPTSCAREEVFAGLLAALIGMCCGLVVVWFRVVLGWARLFLQGGRFDGRGTWIVLVPAIGGFIAALLVQKFFPGLLLGSITGTKASLLLNNGYVSLRTTIGEFLASTLAIVSGHPLGPEDPSLHIGAGITSLLGRRMRLSRERLARLGAVGAAAGLAGALNAPLAAVLFVIEVVIGSWTSTAQIGSIVLGSVTSVMVARYFLGSQPLFHVPAIHPGTPRELLGFAIIGVTATLGGVLLNRLIRMLRARMVALPAWTYCLQVASAGVAVGMVAYLGFPQVMGPGYNIVGQCGQFGWKLLLVLAILKLVLAGLSFATRTPGGIIAPTLFIGAMLGSAIGGLEHLISKNAAVPTSAYVLVGMAALFTVVLRAPVASVLLVAELSGSYSAIFPAIIAVGTSWLLARGLQRNSLFDLLMYQDGMRLPRSGEETSEAVLRVHHAMQQSDFPVVDSCLTVRQAWREVVDRPGNLIFVRNVDAGWTAIPRSLLDRLEATSDPQQRLDEVMDPSPIPELYPDLPLDVTLRYLHRWPVLPVVSRANIRTLQGVITMDTVMARYQSFEAPTRTSRNSLQCA